MNEVAAIVEGPTEQTFVREQLAPHLALLGVTIWPQLPGRGRGAAGVRSWTSVRHDVVRILRRRRYCTTMFDFYGMPFDWPGRRDAKILPWNTRGTHVEAALQRDVLAVMGGGFDAQYFIPYVQLHEFEALLFADLDVLSDLTDTVCRYPAGHSKARFAAVLAEAEGPEAINDGFETCPARRVLRVAPAYRKALHGPIVARRIGLNRLRAACPHFNDWVIRLERLSLLTPSDKDC